MKKLLPLVLLLLLASCSKETTVINNYPDTLPFRIRGVNDLRVERSPFSPLSGFPESILYLQVIYGFGNVRRVQLSVSALPGIKTAFTTTTGTPDFYTQLYITDSLTAPAGTYEMRLTAQPDSGLAQTLKFNLQLAGDTNCTGYFAGKRYQSISSCPQQPTLFEGARLQRIAPDNDTLLLTGFRGDGLSLKIAIDCKQQSVLIPTQTVGGSTFSGSGSLQLVYGNPPATPVFQLQEITAGGTVTTCSYALQPLNQP